MTLREAKDRALKLMEQYSNNGQILGDEDRGRLDNTLRLPTFLDMAQRQAALAKPILRTWTVSQLVPPNKIPGGARPRVKEREDLCLEVDAATAYCYTVDGEALVFIEEWQKDGPWQARWEERIPAGEGPQRYKGIIPQWGGRIRLRFSGLGRYTVLSCALFDGAFRSRGQVPDYGPRLSHPLPPRFLRLHTLGAEGKPFEDYRVEDGALLLPENFRGVLRAVYEAAPAPIGPETPEDAEFEVAPDAQEALPYLAASQCLVFEHPEAANYFMDLGQHLLNNLRREGAPGRSRVANSAFGGGRAALGRGGRLR